MKLTYRSRRALWLAILFSLGLVATVIAACTQATSVEVTPTATRTPRPSPTVPPSPTPTPAWPVTVYIPQGLPFPVVDALDAALIDHPEFFMRTDTAETADVQIVLNPGPEISLFSEWVFAVVAPFPTLVDEVTTADVVSTWNGTPSGPFGGQPLLMTVETAAALAATQDNPVAGGFEFLVADELLQHAWDTRPTWGLVPFDQLEPRWKVLRVDGQSVLDKDLDTDAYPLVVQAGVTGLERGVTQLQEVVGAPLTNRNPEKMSVVTLTGVTALCRCIGARMESEGVLYPARDIRDWLLEADITHLSNEVSFAENCPPARCVSSMVFCSSPSYFELLEYVDADVIELTGNHLLDWGLAPMENSLRMYEERGIPYYGGGWNAEAALEPLTITHGVHTFAFLGCNPAGPAEDWATDETAGSAPCNFGRLEEQLGPTIRQLRQEGIIPIVTLQYLENPTYEPTGLQKTEFRALSEAGAVIVSGSQAHQPQGFAFQDGNYIHYGLGNLFFDQMQLLEFRQEFIDRHVFYDGRHVSTEVLTAILEDFARPRPMTAEEREALLRVTFAASGW